MFFSFTFSVLVMLGMHLYVFTLFGMLIFPGPQTSDDQRHNRTGLGMNNGTTDIPIIVRYVTKHYETIAKPSADLRTSQKKSNTQTREIKRPANFKCLKMKYLPVQVKFCC